MLEGCGSKRKFACADVILHHHAVYKDADVCMLRLLRNTLMCISMATNNDSINAQGELPE